MKELLEQALRAWDRLPQAERKPGAVEVPDLGKVDARYNRTPPPGGLILTVHTRILDRAGEGPFVRGSCSFPGGDRPARDHVWLTARDWQSLVPAAPRVGDSFSMPPALADRLVRYHLVDNTRGEPCFWEKHHVQKMNLTWTVEEVSDAGLRLRLEGNALLITKTGQRGYDVQMLGRLRYNCKTQAITGFEVVAVGDHWGRGEFTPGERPGRQPLGIVIELSDGRNPADRVPPQAARDWEDYLGPSR
jgi:hypothetical protein